ncbi:MAG: hypothetical protein ACRDWT_01855 [Jatrophihabitantaceae bacterium]
MTFSDYLFDSVLVLLVLRQLRESRLDRKAVLLPLGIIAWVADSYLHTIPTSGNNLVLIVGLTLVGVAFGSISALTTRVRADGGRYALVKAGWTAAGVWVLSMGSRFAFAVWASHGGGPSLYRFGRTHHLSIDVWTAALVLMALGEVLSRTGILLVRSQRTLGQPAERNLVTV